MSGSGWWLQQAAGVLVPCPYVLSGEAGPSALWSERLSMGSCVSLQWGWFPPLLGAGRGGHSGHQQQGSLAWKKLVNSQTCGKDSEQNCPGFRGTGL